MIGKARGVLESRVTTFMLSFISAIALIIITWMLDSHLSEMKATRIMATENSIELRFVKEDVNENKTDIKKLCKRTDRIERVVGVKNDD